MPRKDTEVILNKLYPKVKNKVDSKVIKNFKNMMGEFISARYAQLYDIAPCDRIVFSEEDANKFFDVLQIYPDEIAGYIKETYYGEVANFNPRAAKDPLTVLALCFVRYLILVDKDKKLIELGLIFLSFSGKFYPSIHHGSYPVVAPSEYRHIMEYVVNNKLSQKYDIKRHGSVAKAVISVADTWMATYKDRIKDFDDEDVVYLIQQLHNRIKSFMKNIAEIYYDVYNNKSAYMTYDSDNLDEENYRLADNDSLSMERAVEATMNTLTSNRVDYSRCKSAANGRIKTDELQGILETVLGDQNNVPLVRELISILIAEYYQVSKDKDLANINFISTSIVSKPNSKNPNVIRQAEIVEGFLDETSPAYRKRKSRLATKLAYNKAFLYYIVLTIHSSAK